MCAQDVPQGSNCSHSPPPMTELYLPSSGRTTRTHGRYCATTRGVVVDGDRVFFFFGFWISYLTRAAFAGGPLRSGAGSHLEPQRQGDLFGTRDNCAARVWSLQPRLEPEAKDGGARCVSNCVELFRIVSNCSNCFEFQLTAVQPRPPRWSLRRMRRTPWRRASTSCCRTRL
jgi:hypothetical protein